jgi:hypothetical protein
MFNAVGMSTRRKKTAGLEIVEMILAESTGDGAAQHQVAVRSAATDGVVRARIPQLHSHVLDAGLAIVTQAVEVGVLINDITEAESFD